MFQRGQYIHYNVPSELRPGLATPGGVLVLLPLLLLLLPLLLPLPCWLPELPTELFLLDKRLAGVLAEKATDK